MGLYLGKEKISNVSVRQTVFYTTDISDETTINISGILKGENNKIVPATPGVDYAIPNDSTVTSVNGKTGDVTVNEVPTVTASDNGKLLRVVSGAWAVAEVDNATPSLGITGAAVGQAPIVKTIDEQGKPTEWEPTTLAKADGSNIPSNAMGTWRDKIAALPGTKIYGKADSSGKIMAYTDKACTEEINYLLAMELSDYGNLLLIYDHKTYQCVGFEEAASMQGSGYYLVAVLFRSEIVTDSSGAAVLKVETAKVNVMDYMNGMINAPITITAGELPLTTTTTT